MVGDLLNKVFPNLHFIMMRDMCCSSGKLLVALCLILSFCRTCKALDGHQNCSSLCGDHNISSPFRLKDSPEKCGDHRYNLSCKHNQLVMYWESGRYSVLSINYQNYTIRVEDASIVELDSFSLPEHSLTAYNFSGWGPYEFLHARYENGTWLWYGLNTDMIYVRCEHPVDSPGFVDAASCFNTSNVSAASSSSSSSSSYACVGNEYAWDVGLEENCHIEMMYMTLWSTRENQSAWTCTDIHKMLLYGFELSWLDSFCPGSGHDYEIILGAKEPHCQIDFSSISKLSIMMIVELWCIRIKPNDDPSVNKVVEMLEGDDNELEIPQKPYLYPQDIPDVDVSNHSSSIISSSDPLTSDYKATTSFSTHQEDGTSA